MKRKHLVCFLLLLSILLFFIGCGASAENLLKNGNFQDMNEDGMPTEWYTDAYMMELSHIDSIIEEVVNACKATGIYENTLFVITSDHGGHDKTHGQPVMYRRRKQENVVHLSGLFMSDYDHLPFDPRELYEKTLRPGYPWKTRLAHLTSSGEGLRLVSEWTPQIGGNIADQQYLQSLELGMLNVMGTTGKHVTDNSCVNCDKFSFCPREEDLLFVDKEQLFHF